MPAVGRDHDTRGPGAPRQRRVQRHAATRCRPSMPSISGAAHARAQLEHAHRREWRPRAAAGPDRGAGSTAPRRRPDRPPVRQRPPGPVTSMPDTGNAAGLDLGRQPVSRQQRHRARVDRVAAQLVAREHRAVEDRDVARRRAPAPARRSIRPARRRRPGHRSCRYSMTDVNHGDHEDTRTLERVRRCRRAPEVGLPLHDPRFSVRLRVLRASVVDVVIRQRTEHNGAVLRSEPEAVAQRRLGRAARPVFGMTSRSHAGSGSRWLMVGGRNPRDSASAAVTTPAAPLAPCGWPIIDLIDEPGTPLGVSAEDLAHAARLHRVVQQRRRAVIVDVADLVERAARALDRQRMARDDLLAVRRHLHAVIRVAGRSVAVDRRVDRSRRARARDPRARARPSTRPRRARSRRGPGRTAATLRPAGRCSASTRRASAKSRRSCPGVTHASVPPDRSTSASPERISAAA